MPLTATCMDLEIITLKYVRQKDKYYGGVISGLIYKTATDSHTK